MRGFGCTFAAPEPSRGLGRAEPGLPEPGLPLAEGGLGARAEGGRGTIGACGCASSGVPGESGGLAVPPLPMLPALPPRAVAMPIVPALPLRGPPPTPITCASAISPSRRGPSLLRPLADLGRS